MKVAIVGAEESKWPKDKIPFAKEQIRQIFWDNSYMNPETPASGFYKIVSGHSPKGGIDIWVEEYLKSIGEEKLLEPYPPKGNHWADHYSKEGILEEEGYKSRNIQIAKACDILYCISPKGVWNGGLWTAQEAEKIGKKVIRIEI